ncbi:unnamed protein product, partial [Discosporangium mesarthrocarpum]
GGSTVRPFAQQVATLVQRIPLGSAGTASSPNVTLALREQVQHCSTDTPLHQVPSFGGQRTVRGYSEGELGQAKNYALATAEVRVPLKNLMGQLPTQVAVKCSPHSL